MAKHYGRTSHQSKIERYGWEVYDQPGKKDLYMEQISSRKRIEIALLAGMVAYDALSLQKIEHIDLLKVSFSQLIEDLKELDRAINQNV